MREEAPEKRDEIQRELRLKVLDEKVENNVEFFKLKGIKGREKEGAEKGTEAKQVPKIGQKGILEFRKQEL